MDLPADHPEQDINLFTRTMLDLHIPKTKSTPEMRFLACGILLITGISRPENAFEVYREAIEWLENYCRKPSECTTLNLNFTYLDTSSVRCMVDFVKMMYTLESGGFDASVNWYYEKIDTDLYDVGDALQSIAKVKVNLIAYDAAM